MPPSTATVLHGSEYFEPPIIGLGHSIGATQLCHLADVHPALFHSLILIEPSIYVNPSRALPLKQAKQLALRPQRYSSMADARRKLGLAFRRWDPRALELYFKHELRRPDEDSEAVITRTPPDAELALVARPNTSRIGQERPLRGRADILANPHMDTSSHWLYPYYSPSARLVFQAHPTVRPLVLFIDGSASHAAESTRFAKARVERCGTGVGGSGGIAEGQVGHAVLEGASHAMVVDKDALPHLSRIVAEKTADDVAIWMEEDGRRMRNREGKTRQELQNFDPTVKRLFVEWDGVMFLKGREREEAIGAMRKRQDRRMEARSCERQVLSFGKTLAAGA